MSEKFIRSHEMQEADLKPQFIVRRISEGLAFGYGNIDGADEANDVLQAVDETIHQSTDLLVPIDKDDSGRVLDDDGCGDGRSTGLIFRFNKIFKRNLNRAKVFGGAVAMTSAGLIGAGLADGKKLNDVFDASISLLAEKNMNFGAHTDEHAAGENCGCGAIDMAPEAVRAAVTYQEPIRNVVTALGVDTRGLDTVLSNFETYADTLPRQPAFSGRKVMEKIIAAGKVVKQLSGKHRERRIILNTVPGYTVNQELIRSVSGSKVQAFAVDIPRLEEIAHKAFDSPDLRHAAYLSELVYTLAISAVLTKGNLPVDMIEPAPAPAAA